MNYETVSPRDYIGKILIDIATNNNKIVVIDSDLSSSVTTNKFQEKFPERFFEIGIAEQNSLGITSGLSLEGLIPFYVNFSIFCTGTVWTQLRQACYAKLNIKIIGTHPGMDDGPDGATHHALEDLALTRALPNLTILNPIDVNDLEAAIKKAIEINGPVYIRCARDIVPVIHNTPLKDYSSESEIIYDNGNDGAIIFEGTACKQALDGYLLLKDLGFKNKLISIKQIKPLNKEYLVNILKKVKKVVTVENHTIYGGLATIISEIIAEYNLNIKLEKVGVNDIFTESGETIEVKEKYGLSGENVKNIYLK